MLTRNKTRATAGRTRALEVVRAIGLMAASLILFGLAHYAGAAPTAPSGILSPNR